MFDAVPVMIIRYDREGTAARVSDMDPAIREYMADKRGVAMTKYTGIPVQERVGTADALRLRRVTL